MLYGEKKVLSVGIIWDAKIKARDIIMNGLHGATYIYKDQKRIFRVRQALAGYHNVYNSLMALACVIDVGVPAYKAREIISNLKGIDGRFELSEGDISVIVDYAHTAEAFENILKSVNSLKKNWQNVITVFGCGGERDRKKRAKMAAVAQLNSSFVIVTEDNSRSENLTQIIEDILSGFTDVTKRSVITTRSAAICSAVMRANDGDIVVILGKGNEKYSIDKNGYHDYDEKAVISDALKKRKEYKRENTAR